MGHANIKIVTFNFCLAPFFRKPYKRIVDFKKSLSVDFNILNFQEIYTYDMLWRLHRALGGRYHLTYNPGLYGPRSGLVTLSHDKPLDYSFFSLPKQKGILISQHGEGVMNANVHLVTNTDG